MKGFWTILACLIFLLNRADASNQSSSLSDENHSLYNIILIINDQETYQLPMVPDYQLPARRTLMERGVTFRNHYTAAAMCSPSRATLLTGVPPQVHGVYDQMEYDFVPELSPDQPNIGSILKELGYRTAYFGKFEMNKELLINAKETVNYSTLAKPYGFDAFNPDGDVGGEPQQGYQDDVYFVGEAVRWLRKNSKNEMHQPFFLVVSLLNPHDITYGDANLPNLPIAQTTPISILLPPPVNKIYAKEWSFSLPITLEDSLSTPGMPPALLEYQNGWSGALGWIPTNRKDMWRFYDNYYLNAIRDNDKNLQHLIHAMNELGLWKNTIIIFTADHGEMGGAHGGLRGRGPMAYEENTHIPLIIDHPKAPHGVSCIALTSHMDLLPTIVGLTGLSEKKRYRIIKDFAGHDFSSLLMDTEKIDVHAVRPAVLFNYVGISTIDSHYLTKTMVASFFHKTFPALTEIDLNKRGFLVFVFDGRYKFARYYSPNAFNTPKTLAEIFKYNDVQLFDLKTDPNEIYNLALEPEKNKPLILQMNALLNEMIEKEVGDNDGDFLPKSVRRKISASDF